MSIPYSLLTCYIISLPANYFDSGSYTKGFAASSSKALIAIRTMWKDIISHNISIVSTF